MSKTNRVGSAFSTLPFDGIDNVANVFLHDDFITAIPVADVAAGTLVSSELNWMGMEAVVTIGPGLTTKLVSVAKHPGILRLTNAAAAGDATSLILGGNLNLDEEAFVLDANGIYISSIVRMSDADNCLLDFGLIGQAPVAPDASPADLVGFVYTAADVFEAQVCAATVDVVEAFTLTYVEGDWIKLEVYATSSDAYFRLTTEDGVETVHLNVTMPVVGLVPAFTIGQTAAESEHLDIDAFHLRYSRPSEAANAGISWLGA